MLGDPGFRQQSQGAMRSRRHRRRVQAGVDIYSTRRQREHCERGRGGGRFATPNPVQTIAHNFATLAWGFGGGGDGANITCTGPPAPPPLHVRSVRDHSDVPSCATPACDVAKGGTTDQNLNVESDCTRCSSSSALQLLRARLCAQHACLEVRDGVRSGHLWCIGGASEPGSSPGRTYRPDDGL